MDNNQHRDDRDFGDGSDYPRFEPLPVPKMIELQVYVDTSTDVEIDLDDLCDSNDQLLDIDDFIFLSDSAEIDVAEVIAMTEKPTKPIREAALEKAKALSRINGAALGE